MRTFASVRTLEWEPLQAVYWVEWIGFLIKKKKIWLLFYSNSQGVKREIKAPKINSLFKKF